MRTHNHSAAVAVLISLLLTSGSALAQQSRTTREQNVPIAVDYAPAPPTVEALFQASDLVVVATLDSAIYQNAKGMVTSHFKANVVEVLNDKRKGPIGPVIDVYRIGGKQQTATGMKDIDELHFRRWSDGMKLLLFLHWNATANAYFPMGPDGAYQLDPVTKKVRAFGKGSVARTWHGRDIAAVMTEAKSKAKTARP